MVSGTGQSSDCSDTGTSAASAGQACRRDVSEILHGERPYKQVVRLPEYAGPRANTVTGTQIQKVVTGLQTVTGTTAQNPVCSP